MGSPIGDAWVGGPISDPWVSTASLLETTEKSIIDELYETNGISMDDP